MKTDTIKAGKAYVEFGRRSLDLVNLSPIELETLRKEVNQELSRRIDNPHGCDFADIRSNEAAKRAASIAILGGHSILLVGPPSSGKTMIRSAMAAMGANASYESRPCPCGYRGDAYLKCECEPKRVERHVRLTWPRCDITIETHRVPVQEINLRGTSSGEIRIQVDLATPINQLDPIAHYTENKILCTWLVDTGASTAIGMEVIKLAGTIARLDGWKSIGVVHICEAINYQRVRS